ncbi:MAG: TrkH family potassium uptake protein [Planifilum sp.]|jgi:trk system potassium uptake protein TrkH
MNAAKTRHYNPSQILVFGSVLTILIGTILLMMPFATEDGEPLSLVDALFTATSAACVTGLAVKDTATTFSTFGEVVILILIQIGGLGFMTFTTLIAVLLGKKISVKERLILREAMNQLNLEGVVKLVLYVLLITAVIEGVGTLLLALRWVPEWGWEKGLYYSLFHAISAFNNAGFDLFGDEPNGVSLSRYATDPVVNLVVMVLVLLGSLGFVVFLELVQYRRTRRLSLHSKLVLAVTGMVVLAGTTLFWLIEWRNPRTIGSLSLPEKVLAGLFQMAASRTSGFLTLDAASLYPPTQFLLILLMFVGGAPNSTAGGIKLTTFAVILLAVWAMIRGRDDVVVFYRRIPHQQVYKALTITVLALVLVFTVTILLLITEYHDARFLEALYEASSAFAINGSSLGLTSQLTTGGKILLSLTMFVGRLGPVTLAYAISRRITKPSYRYPEERPLIG